MRRPSPNQMLLTAVWAGDVEAARQAFMAGADPNAQVQHCTMLQETLNGTVRLEMAGFLLQAGADINGRDTIGRTALHFAAAGGDLKVVNFLLEHGADPDLKAEDGKTPLDSAIAYGNHSKIGERLQSRMRRVEGKDLDGLLILSARNNDLACVHKWLDLGANPNASWNTGDRPLHLAAIIGSFAVAQALVTRGADIHARNNTKDTALHTAAWYGRADIVAFLCERGADTNATSNTGDAPLHKAAWGYHVPIAARLDVVTLLLAAGANPNTKNNEGYTPAEMALKWGHPPAAQAISPSAFAASDATGHPYHWIELGCQQIHRMHYYPNDVHNPYSYEEDGGPREGWWPAQFSRRAAPERKNDFIQAGAGWFLPWAEKMARTETVTTAEILAACRKQFGRDATVQRWPVRN